MTYLRLYSIVSAIYYLCVPICLAIFTALTLNFVDFSLEIPRWWVLSHYKNNNSKNNSPKWACLSYWNDLETTWNIIPAILCNRVGRQDEFKETSPKSTEAFWAFSVLISYRSLIPPTSYCHQLVLLLILSFLQIYAFLFWYLCWHLMIFVRRLNYFLQLFYSLRGLCPSH